MEWDIKEATRKSLRYRAKCKKFKYFCGKTEVIRVPSLLVKEVYEFIEKRDREFYEKASQIKCSELVD